MKVDFYRHHLGEPEIKELLETLGSSFLTAGPKTSEFERRFANYLNVPSAVGVTSCTAGLFLALKALGVGEGDEVILPPMTFIASANVVLHCGAKPVFVDVEAESGLLDLSLVEAAITDKTKAIMPVHLYGNMVDMRKLKSLADHHGLKIVEDAAHATESIRDGVRPGQLGDSAAFSFYATKNLTSGEGGAVTALNDDFGQKLRVLRQHGMSKSAAERYHNRYQHWDMVELGYKFNMFDIQAALLLPQIEGAESLLKRREKISQYYESAFSKAGIEFPKVPQGCRSARHLFTVWAPKGKRDDVLAKLQEKQVGVAVNYRAIHLLTYYKNLYGFQPGSYPIAEDIGDRTLTIPLYPKLTDAEVEYVTTSLISSI